MTFFHFLLIIILDKYISTKGRLYEKDKKDFIIYVSGSKATVTVKCKYLDSTKTYNSFMTNFVFFILNNLDKNYSDKVLVKKSDKIFKETLKDSKSAFKMKYTTKTFKINLIKENGKWKIATVSKGLANAVTSNFFKATELFFN